MNYACIWEFNNYQLAFNSITLTDNKVAKTFKNWYVSSKKVLSKDKGAYRQGLIYLYFLLLVSGGCTLSFQDL